MRNKKSRVSYNDHTHYANVQKNSPKLSPKLVVLQKYGRKA